jgi:hypothetical protein
MDKYNIYPKQFRNSKIPTEKNRCFFLMPFNEKFDNIYGNIKKALNDNGYICNRADEISGSTPIMNTILNEILKSQFIISDLTNQNPNVFYELGVAHTFKDAQNTILITQKVEDIPFDLRHIYNIVYDPNNIKYLTSSILNALKENKYLMGFYEALQQKNIISIINDNQEEFVDHLQGKLSDLIPLATEILCNQINDVDEREIERYFERLLGIVNQIINDRNYSFINGILKVLFESIITCSRFNITDKITYDFLYGNLFSSYYSENSEFITHQTDLAICLASQRVKINTVMTWIIGYLANSKSATIDLNRYKVERFLMVTNDKIIDGIIVDSLFDKNCYIREHLADIVGEKRLLEAEDSLISQLMIEENYFTAVSLIAALGKLESNRGAATIMRFIELKIDDIVKTNQLFVLKHCHIAFSRIDKKHGLTCLASFNIKYGSYIKDYFIL